MYFLRIQCYESYQPPNHQIPAANFQKCSVHFSRGPCLIWQGGWLLSFCLKQFFSHMFWVKPITTCHQFASMHPITYSSDQKPDSETTSPEFDSQKLNKLNIYLGFSVCIGISILKWKYVLNRSKQTANFVKKIRILRFRIGCLTWWTS